MLRGTLPGCGVGQVLVEGCLEGADDVDNADPTSLDKFDSLAKQMFAGAEAAEKVRKRIEVTKKYDPNVGCLKACDAAYRGIGLSYADFVAGPEAPALLEKKHRYYWIDAGDLPSELC